MMDQRIHLSKYLARALAATIALTVTVWLAGCASSGAPGVAETPASKLISDIVASEDETATVVTIKGNRPLTYTAVKQDFPQGVLFHFPNTALDNIKNVYYPPQSDTIGSIRASQIDEGGQTTRIFIALKHDAPYSLKPDGNNLVISFPRPAAPAEAEPQETAAAVAPSAAVPEKPAPPAATRLSRITTDAHNEYLAIQVLADGTIADYKSFTMDKPDRIVFDLPGIGSPYTSEQRMVVKSKFARLIRHFAHPDKLRIVIETDKVYFSKVTAAPIEDGLLIHIGDVPAASAGAGNQQPSAETAAAAPAAAAETSPTAAPATVEKDPAPEAPAAETAPAVAANPEGPAWINRINFFSEDAGKSAVVIGTTHPVAYDLEKADDKQLHLTLKETNLPDYRRHALITTRFSSAVDRITPLQEKQNQTLFLIEMREAVPYTIQQTDNVIRLDFAASNIPPKPYEDADLPAWKKVVAEADNPPAMGKINLVDSTDHTASAPELSLEERLKSAAPPETRYTGEKIALDFYDTDIKNVFRILREISGKNFAIDKNVTGKVTLTLEKPVPWDQVLDLVLKMNQLGLTMEGDIIRIATLSTLAQEDKLRQAQLKAEQQAKQQEEELEPLTTEYLPINYSNAANEILPHLQNILTENRGKISVDQRNNQIIITDTADKIRQAKEIVAQIDKVTPQVIIEARIVEANSNFVREIGFDWGTITLDAFDLGDVASFGPTTLTADNIPVNFSNLGSIGFNFATLTDTAFSIVDAKIQASDVEGKTNIVSSPKIVTLDNKKAKIKQGFEVPYLERDSSGNATVKFKNVDLLLEVTPTVTPDDRIVMEIFVTKNDLVDPSADEPALSTNEAQTEILVDDGNTIVIGGILKDTSTWTEAGIPGLRKIPALGWLFKSNKTDERKNELLIFITPQIVKLEQRKLS